MIEKIGYIKNPLSVIAIFAAIAEISGTTVLPFIAEENQSVYIWFLMLFPVFLVGSFFLTLNFNHRVLYAPSDYKDENNFVTLFDKAKPDEQSRKLHDEVEEIEADKGHVKEVKNVDDSINVVERDNKRNITADVILAEKLAINSLARNLGVDFKTAIKFNFIKFSRRLEKSSINMKMSVIFDGVHISDHNVNAVEVKLFKTNEIDLSRFSSVISTSELVASKCSEVSSKDFTLHIFAVMDAPGVEVKELKKKLSKSMDSSVINIVPHVTTLNDLLMSEYQNST